MTGVKEKKAKEYDLIGKYVKEMKDKQGREYMANGNASSSILVIAFSHVRSDMGKQILLTYEHAGNSYFLLGAKFLSLIFLINPLILNMQGVTVQRL